MRLKSLALIALLVPLAGCEKSPSLRRWEIMNRIEHRAPMPSGARPLGSYSRYYAWIEHDRRVLAVYVRGQSLGRRWVNRNHIPSALQPGCDVVSLIWDVPEGRVEKIACNRTA